MPSCSSISSAACGWHWQQKNTAPGSHGTPPLGEASISDAMWRARLTVLAV
jgi:hypothetical protein